MCLKFLDISDNKIASIRDLSGFYELHTLVAKNNLIDDVNDLTATISTLTSLKDLSLQKNPVTLSYKYRETLIANSVSLGKGNIYIFRPKKLAYFMIFFCLNRKDRMCGFYGA